MKLLLPFPMLWVMLIGAGYAQTTHFDIFSFTPPLGWSTASGNDYIAYSAVKGNSFCQIILYKAVQGSGDALQDFETEWQSLVARSTTLAGELTKVSSTSQGWNLITGTALVSAPGSGNFTSRLATYSGQERRSSILINYNDNTFQEKRDKFIQEISVEALSPVAGSHGNASSGAGAPVPGSGSAKAWASTQNEGWKVEALPEYLRCTREGMEIRQYYGIRADEEAAFNQTVEYYWNLIVAMDFQVPEIKVYQNDMFAYLRIYFGSGKGTDMRTGQTYFVALDIRLEKSVAYPKVAIFSSEAAYNALFPHPNDLAATARLNSFPVSAEGLQGKWNESGFAGAQMYEVLTGSYAGMNTVSSATELSFLNGQYQRKFNSASGMVGNMSFVSLEEGGNYFLSQAGSEVLLQPVQKNQYSKDITYRCAYIATRRGMALWLQDKAAESMVYFLTKDF